MEAQQRVLTVHGVWVEFFYGVPDRIRPVEHRVWEGSRWREREVGNRWSASRRQAQPTSFIAYNDHSLHSLLPSLLTNLILLPPPQHISVHSDRLLLLPSRHGQKWLRDFFPV